MDEWKRGRLLIATSSITMLEVLSAQFTESQKHDFSGMFSKPGLELIDVDRRVSGKAS